MPIKREINPVLTAAVFSLFEEVEGKVQGEEPITEKEFCDAVHSGIVADAIAIQINESRDPNFWERMQDDTNYNGE
jgi:hypothetical protein